MSINNIFFNVVEEYMTVDIYQSKTVVIFLFSMVICDLMYLNQNPLCCYFVEEYVIVENYPSETLMLLLCFSEEYVTCHTCRSPDTILQKDTRIFFLQCETCGSRCSVASIKSGFQAVTGKRAAIRAKKTA